MIGLLCIGEDNAGCLDNCLYKTIEDLNETNIYEVALAKKFLGFKILKL